MSEKTEIRAIPIVADHSVGTVYNPNTLYPIPKEICSSGGYQGLLVFWAELFCPLGGRGLLAGEKNPKCGEEAKKFLPKFEWLTTDIEGGDIRWDLCQPHSIPAMSPFDLIISQAVLEHITDPVQMVRSLLFVLQPGGVLLCQGQTPSIPLHRYSIDVWRLMPDAPQAIADLVGAELLDWYYNDERGHCFFALRKL